MREGAGGVGEVEAEVAEGVVLDVDDLALGLEVAERGVEIDCREVGAGVLHEQAEGEAGAAAESPGFGFEFGADDDEAGLGVGLCVGGGRLEGLAHATENAHG